MKLFLSTALLTGFLTGLGLHVAAAPVTTSFPQATGADTELMDVARVVDGDTIHVMRAGKLEKLRLLSVDTEEKLTGRTPMSPTKPETLFGQECALWAQAFFDELATDDRPAQVALRFPEGREARDVYGRLLCHVILPDGRDFNLLLVQLGKSPYFNKYGNSLIAHDDFVKAQKEARAKKLGVWNPDTNRPKDAGAPSAKRPYAELLPWWDARAEAVDAFRKASAESGAVIAADDPEALRAAFESGETVRVFCSVDRFFDEDDGTRTVLLRGSRDYALRVSLPGTGEGELFAFLEGTRGEFRQNYLWLTGKLERGPRGPVIRSPGRDAWSLAGPEPKLP